MSLPGKSTTITVEPLKTTQPAKEPVVAPPVKVPDREKIPA